MTECDFSTLPLKLPAISVVSTEQDSPSDTDAVLLTLLQHVLRRVISFMSYFVQQNIVSSLSLTKPLTLRLISPPRFLNFCFACSTIMCSLAAGVQAAERDVTDRAGGLAAVPCYCCSLIDKSARLSASLPWSSGAATWCCMLMSEHGVIQHENEKAGVGVTEGRRDAAQYSHSTWRV